MLGRNRGGIEIINYFSGASTLNTHTHLTSLHKKGVNQSRVTLFTDSLCFILYPWGRSKTVELGTFFVESQTNSTVFLLFGRLVTKTVTISTVFCTFVHVALTSNKLQAFHCYC